jgi:hypothetical protein
VAVATAVDGSEETGSLEEAGLLEAKTEVVVAEGEEAEEREADGESVGLEAVDLAELEEGKEARVERREERGAWAETLVASAGRATTTEVEVECKKSPTATFVRVYFGSFALQQPAVEERRWPSSLCRTVFASVSQVCPTDSLLRSDFWRCTRLEWTMAWATTLLRPSRAGPP